jgi:hypothetical protein
MKQERRRRQLRPRPCRSQINQQLEHIRSTTQLFQLEALLEASKPEPNLPRLQFLDHMLGLMQEEAASLEMI